MISMNNPAEYGGYTLFQSSYRMNGRQKISFLSVARDPGKPIVFAGYIGMMGGMCLVLVTRIKDRRRIQAAVGGDMEAERAASAVSFNIEPKDRFDAAGEAAIAPHRDDAPASSPSARG